jgi:hypothetical protein
MSQLPANSYVIVCSADQRTETACTSAAGYMTGASSRDGQETQTKRHAKSCVLL